jgi:hypothetical protein
MSYAYTPYPSLVRWLRLVSSCFPISHTSPTPSLRIFFSLPILCRTRLRPLDPLLRACTRLSFPAPGNAAAILAALTPYVKRILSAFHDTDFSLGYRLQTGVSAQPLGHPYALPYIKPRICLIHRLLRGLLARRHPRIRRFMAHERRREGTCSGARQGRHSVLAGTRSIRLLAGVTRTLILDAVQRGLEEEKLKCLRALKRRGDGIWL